MLIIIELGTARVIVFTFFHAITLFLICHLQIEDFREVAGPSWGPVLNSFVYTVQKNMLWRADNEDRIAAWLNVPSDMRTDRSLFTIENPKPRPDVEVDPDIFFGPRHMQAARRK